MHSRHVIRIRVLVDQHDPAVLAGDLAGLFVHGLDVPVEAPAGKPNPAAVRAAQAHGLLAALLLLLLLLLLLFFFFLEIFVVVVVVVVVVIVEADADEAQRVVMPNFVLVCKRK